MKISTRYQTSEDLPSGVRLHLPAAGQEIYREAFNRTFESSNDERLADSDAWEIVRRTYEKFGTEWTKRSFENW